MRTDQYRLIKTPPQLPIIALTALAIKGDDKKAYDAGCDAYITKPIRKAKLMEAIGKFL